MKILVSSIHEIRGGHLERGGTECTSQRMGKNPRCQQTCLNQWCAWVTIFPTQPNPLKNIFNPTQPNPSGKNLNPTQPNPFRKNLNPDWPTVRNTVFVIQAFYTCTNSQCQSSQYCWSNKTHWWCQTAEIQPVQTQSVQKKSQPNPTYPTRQAKILNPPNPTHGSGGSRVGWVKPNPCMAASVFTHALRRTLCTFCTPPPPSPQGAHLNIKWSVCQRY